jgi:PAS domain S-box-containing protein
MAKKEIINKGNTVSQPGQRAVNGAGKSAQTVESALERSNKLLHAITRAQMEFITNVDSRELYDGLLENLLDITDSEYGFIGELLYDPDGTPYLKTHAITNIAWNQETLKFYEENAPQGLEFRNLKTLFGTVITRAEAVISNDPDNDIRAGGRPEGHPPLNAFLGLPFFSGKEFIGMVGIANRPGGYDEELVHFLRPFLITCANIIQAFRVDRKRILVEESLTGSETKNQAILNTVASGIITINEQTIIQDFNTAAERIFGYSAKEVIGHKVTVLMPEPYSSNHDTYVQNYINTGVRRVIGIGRDVVGRRKDGSTFPVELTVNEMRISGKRMFVGALTDITLRKQAEEALIAAKESAEEANRLKSEFINVISHELRTPLTVILGNAPLLTDPDDMPDSEEIAEIARDIQEDGEHLLTLINDLLDISKLEAGKMQLHPEILDARTVVEEAADFIRSLAQQKGIALESQAQDMAIKADPVRIKQILINLLGNAVKFTDAGSIRVRAYSENGMACFEVSDTGCGMREEDLPRIFDVFQQVDSSSTRKASGTGLGLTITKRLVELHHGRISVRTRLNKGSVFTFTIPLAREEEA